MHSYNVCIIYVAHFVGPKVRSENNSSFHQWDITSVFSSSKSVEYYPVHFPKLCSGCQKIVLLFYSICPFVSRHSTGNIKKTMLTHVNK